MSLHFTAPIRCGDQLANQEVNSIEEMKNENTDVVGLTFSRARKQIAARFKETIGILSSQIRVKNCSSGYFALIFIVPLLVSCVAVYGEVASLLTKTIAINDCQVALLFALSVVLGEFTGMPKSE